MEKLCRVCLSEDGRMHYITNTHLEATYRALAMTSTHDSRPVYVCYICHARLQNCHQLKKQCLQSAELFSQMLSKKLDNLSERISGSLKVVPIIHLSVGGVVQENRYVSVKLEKPEELGDDADIFIDTKDEPAEETEVEKIDSRVEDDCTTCVVKCEPQDDEIGTLEPEMATLAEHQEIILKHAVVRLERLEWDFGKAAHLRNNSGLKGKERAEQETVLEADVSNRESLGDDARRHSRKTRDENNLGKYSVTHNTENYYQCDVCKKYLKGKYNMTYHMNTHTTSYQCEVCKKCLCSQRQLDCHMRIHTDIKPFQCEVCKKGFRRKDALKFHNMREHTGERPYQCTLCDKSFVNRTYLNTHMRCHKQQAHKPFECKVCNGYFSYKHDHSSSELHQDVGNDTKLYQCDDCGKSYSKKESYIAHKRKPCFEKKSKPRLPTVFKNLYQCSVCEDIFICKNSYKNHIISHTGEKPNPCDICKRDFISKSALKKHMLIHSKENRVDCDHVTSVFFM